MMVQTLGPLSPGVNSDGVLGFSQSVVSLICSEIGLFKGGVTEMGWV